MKLQTGTKPHSIRKLEKKMQCWWVLKPYANVVLRSDEKNVNLGVAMPGKIIIKFLWYFIYIFSAMCTK